METMTDRILQAAGMIRRLQQEAAIAGNTPHGDNLRARAARVGGYYDRLIRRVETWGK